MTKFSTFLLAEYSNIAQAHFKSIETISTFFRYYLLIMSVPISALAIISKIGSGGANILIFVKDQNVVISIIFYSVSSVGLMAFCYVLNLRMDVILYARVVNGIRKFFYDESNKDINLMLRLKVLPQSPLLPSYLEKSYFFPVVMVFSIIDSLYGLFANIILNISGERLEIGYSWLILPSGICLHFLVYLWLSHHREVEYLKSNIIGIDIDGVLNKHRDHFCNLIKELTQKKICPDDIIHIPVHEYPTLGITREEARRVFNDARYWSEMPPIEYASEIINRLKNTFNMQIYIFSYRPWPDSKSKEELLKCKREFIQSCYNDVMPNPIEPIEQITKNWLSKHNFLYDKLIIEMGNDYSSDPRSEFKNRFYISRKRKVRYFVEDDYEKAIKLSFICDIVFLYSHPYNEPDDRLPSDISKRRRDLPSNIIRVKTWNDIYQEIRRLS